MILEENNRGELEEIIRKYADMIYRTALVQTGNRDQADDIFQEVCEKIWTHGRQFESEEHCKAWILRVVVNSCKNMWNSAWNRRMVVNTEQVQTISESGAGPEKERDHEAVGTVIAAVQKLPAKYRMAVHLYYYEEYSQKEIAEILSVRENSVSSRLSRARKMLRKMLEKEGGDRYEF